jgi:hypothetical protein
MNNIKLHKNIFIFLATLSLFGIISSLLHHKTITHETIIASLIFIASCINIHSCHIRIQKNNANENK